MFGRCLFIYCLYFIVSLTFIGADINGVNKYGETPLHRGAVVGGLLVIKTLLEAGANVHIKDNNGLTPFDGMSM